MMECKRWWKRQVIWTWRLRNPQIIRDESRKEKARSCCGRRRGSCCSQRGQGTLLEVNSETDFVARMTISLAFADRVIAGAAASASTDVAALMAGELERCPFCVGAKILVRISPCARIAKIEAKVVGAYVHSNEKLRSHWFWMVVQTSWLKTLQCTAAANRW